MVTLDTNERAVHPSLLVEARMKNLCIALIVAVASLTVAPGPVPAESPRRVEDPAARPEPSIKDRPARVVAIPSEAPVNINTAGVKELMTLSGVGKKAAERIVAHREARGPFKKPDDIKKIDGIGEAVWEKNRPRIVVR
jgi:competence protein ComEA